MELKFGWFGKRHESSSISKGDGDSDIVALKRSQANIDHADKDRKSKISDNEAMRLFLLPEKIMHALSKGLVGREEEAKLIVIALMIREHVVFIGEPGISKSQIAEKTANLVKAKFFKYQLAETTRPEEIIGPLDIKAFRRSEFKRNHKNKLPEAEIAFLDEIFNADSFILNDLLSIFQEKVIYDGEAKISVPLHTAIGTSNNVPTSKNLVAIYDRMLLRSFPEPVPESRVSDLVDAVWANEFRHSKADNSGISKLSDMNKIYENLLESIDLSKIKPRLVEVLAMLEKQNIHLSDRRKGKVLKAVAAHALLERRTIAIEEDLMILVHIAPHNLATAKRVKAMLEDELETPKKYLKILNDINMNLNTTEELLSREAISESDLESKKKFLLSADDRISKIEGKFEDEELNSTCENVSMHINALLDKIQVIETNKEEQKKEGQSHAE